MEQQEQKLHIVMDESDAPYEASEYTFTLSDDLNPIRFAKGKGMEFEPGSHLDQISKSMSKAPE